MVGRVSLEGRRRTWKAGADRGTGNTGVARQAARTASIVPIPRPRNHKTAPYLRSTSRRAKRRSLMKNSEQRYGLLERLAEGPVICAEGYLFELERRGYLQAGPFVPEVVLDHPEEVEQLHRQFVHAGSDVVEAFTYYAHREKLKLIDKEELLERMNRQALALAKEVAEETGTLFAGDVCNTNVYDPDDAEAARQVRSMFEEQVGWAVEAGVDFVIGETFSYAEEALIALETIKQTGLPAVITLAIHRAPETREGWSVAETCKRWRTQ